MVAEDRRLVRLTKACLALPEAARELAGRHARFHVRDKTFAWYLDDHHGDGIVSVSCKMPFDENRESRHWTPPVSICPRTWRIGGGSRCAWTLARSIGARSRSSSPTVIDSLLPSGSRPSSHGAGRERLIGHVSAAERVDEQSHRGNHRQGQAYLDDLDHVFLHRRGGVTGTRHGSQSAGTQSRCQSGNAPVGKRGVSE